MKKRLFTHLCRTAVVFVFLMASLPSRGQIWEPYPEIGAMLSHQRAVSSALIARTGLQEARALLHDDLKVSMIDFQKIEKAMEKAEKAFNVIDLVIQGGATALKIKDTYSTITGTIGNTINLLDTYLERCLKRKSVAPGDTIFIDSSRKMLVTIGDGAKDIFEMIGLEKPPKKDSLLGLVATKHLCSTDDMFFVLGNISDCCDRISSTLNKEYYRLWEYMMLRTGYWKDLPDPRIPTRSICRNAIERWMSSAGSSKKIDY